MSDVTPRPVAATDDVRLADYRDLTNIPGRRKLEGDEFFICEGPVALERLLASDHRLRNLVGDSPAGLIRDPLDITDADAVMACFERHQPTHVIHLAALQVPFCKADPVGGARVNVVGTVALLEAAAALLPNRTFAYASSVAAYGGEDERLNAERVSTSSDRAEILWVVEALEHCDLVETVEHLVSFVSLWNRFAIGSGDHAAVKIKASDCEHDITVTAVQRCVDTMCGEQLL